MAMALFSCRAPTNLTPRPSSVTAKTAVSSLMSPNTVRTPRAWMSSASTWNTGTIRLSSIGLPRVLAAAAGLAVGEVERQEVLSECAVRRRLVSGRVVGADAAWDRLDDDIVVRSEEERAGVARAVVAIDDAVRRRPESIVRVARQHRAGIDDERARHRRRPDPVALGGAHFEARELRLRQERDEVVVGMRREAELVVLGRRMRRVVDQPNRAVRLGEGLGEIVGRQVERQRE